MHAADEKTQKKNNRSGEMVTKTQGRNGFRRTLDDVKDPICRALLQQSATRPDKISISTRKTIASMRHKLKQGSDQHTQEGKYQKPGRQPEHRIQYQYHQCPRRGR